MGWENVRGWFEPGDAWVYDKAVAVSTPTDTIVEIGVAYGRSLALLARRALDLGCRARIIGVDAWEASWGDWGDLRELEPFEACLWEMKRHAPEEFSRVEFWKMRSLDAAAQMKFPISFVFIDAAHDYESVRDDIAAWLPLVRPGGLLAGHDFGDGHPGVEKAVREAFGEAFEAKGSSWLVRL